jgi:hypothetical protein
MHAMTFERFHLRVDELWLLRNVKATPFWSSTDYDQPETVITTGVYGCGKPILQRQRCARVQGSGTFGVPIC